MSTPAWGETLREGGYDTFITGKWHLDAVTLQRSFSHQGPVAPGFLPSTPDMYKRPAFGNIWDAADPESEGHWLQRGLDRTTPDGIQHSSELYADAAATEHLASTSQASVTSFFMYVAFNAPHDPRQAPQQYLDLYLVETIQVLPNFVPDFPFDDGHKNVHDENLALFPRIPRDMQVHRREYYAIITHMDT